MGIASDKGRGENDEEGQCSVIYVRRTLKRTIDAWGVLKEEIGGCAKNRISLDRREHHPSSFAFTLGKG